jgi:vacuolar-type H+-ATPase subunit H
MKLSALILCAFLLGACTQAEDERAREQARRTAEEAKRDSREVLHDAEVGAKKASKEIDEGLNKTRDKVRKALAEDRTDEHRR